MNHFYKLVVLSILMGKAEATEPTCTQQCNTPFGTLIGQAFLTKAYSNCNGDCVNDENNDVVLKGTTQRLFTGMKWQCVEYARRWLIENKGITFGDVKYAYHIWDLVYAETIDTHQKRPFLRFKNMKATEPPQIGDLLINSIQLAITGHVAVVVGVERDSITIAEQNYFNRPWENKHYSRRLLMSQDKHGRYRIYDDALIGWVRVK